MKPQIGALIAHDCPGLMGNFVKNRESRQNLHPVTAQCFAPGFDAAPEHILTVQYKTLSLREPLSFHQFVEALRMEGHLKHHQGDRICQISNWGIR